MGAQSTKQRIGRTCKSPSPCRNQSPPSSRLITPTTGAIAFMVFRAALSILDREVGYRQPRPLPGARLTVKLRGRPGQPQYQRLRDLRGRSPEISVLGDHEEDLHAGQARPA